MLHEKFLVTGCAGFIGGHMVRRLLAEGFSVVGVDDFSSGKRDSMEDFYHEISFIEGDLSIPDVAEKAVAGVDRIIHLASIPSVPRSIEKPLESARSSVMATVSLLNGAWRAGVKRVVQASSSAVYGDTEHIAVETLPTNPLSPYAAAKVSQENYAKAFYLCRGLDVISLRYFNVFGHGQDIGSDYAAVVPKFIALMMAGHSPVIFGDGTQSRDFTYVDNVVEATLAAAVSSNSLGGEVINIGNGGGASVNYLVAELNRIIGTNIQPINAPARVGDIRHSRSDISKAEKMLGFLPRISLAEGLSRLVKM